MIYKKSKFSVNLRKENITSFLQRLKLKTNIGTKLSHFDT